ncbi:apolipoprotein N-acyltransferase [Pseudoduganella sp. GCM10020061]|uniref:apolipoprotein N-acyltransferase n=1 Tax=Pseudoduganella sp. GCM10020061 TaxID=3317345 RepID=UPI0036293B9A
MRFRSKPAADAPRAPRTTVRPMIFAVLAGLSSILSFEPFGWWPVQLVALAWLFYQVGMTTSVKRSAWIGWAFGFGWCVAGMHWLYVAMNTYGAMPAPIAAMAIVLLGAYMGIYGAFATGAASWLRNRWALPVRSFLLVALPIGWGVGEWLRGWVFTGFPWANAGYAHNISPLAGYAPLVGVYGVSIIAALCAGCLAMLTQRARLQAIGLLAAAMAAGFGLTHIEWTTPHGKPMTVRLLQGNVPQDQKFDNAYIADTLKLYQDMVTSAPADLVATPETAIVMFPQQLPPGYLGSFASFAARTGSTVMFGIPFSDGPMTYSNSVGGVNPQGDSYRYDKHHLVPFGEFVPTGFRWFVNFMSIPLGDFTRGAAVQAPFAVKDQLVLPNVCYEDAFGEEIADQLRGSATPATVLLNVSNLAWYGESVAIPQHLQISQMRSLETGRPMLRSTNNGATAIVDGRGKVTHQLPFYTRGALAGTVQGMTGFTPYVRFGNYLFLALSALALAAAFFAARRR